MSIERLTKRYSDGTPFVPNCILQLTNGLSDVIKKLAEYEDLEEEGLLLRLPVSEGSEVWKIINQRDNFSDEEHKIVTRVCFRLNMLTEIGKTIFFTKEEAEANLEKQEKKG